jgi:putative PIN family toxin of toxin-antitoxin system
MSAKPRVVVDTQIFLRAGLKRQSLVGKIVFDLSDRYQIIFSAETKKEVEDVLNRPHLRAKFTQLTDQVVKIIFDIFDSAELVTLPDPIPSVSRDPKDDIFLACAVTGKAQYLVTEDQDPLVLNPYEGVQIIDVPAFFEIIKPT